MIAKGTDAAAVTEEQIQTVAADVETFIKANKITGATVAQAMGYSSGVVSEFLSGKYKGNKAQVAIDLDQWLIEEEQRRSRPTTTQYVATEVALEIQATANYCLDRRTIGLIYGPDTSGIGKTTALMAYAQQMGPRRCTMVTMEKVAANPTGMIRKLCDAMRLGHGGNNDQRIQRIKEHLRGRSHLLIIDQVHDLRGAKDDKPFYILHELHDETKTAQLWCGTADLYTYLTRERARKADESLTQVRSRMFPIVDLMEGVGADGNGGGKLLATVDQVMEIFAKNSMKITRQSARWLCELANLPDSGSLRLCRQLVEYATMLCELRGMSSIDVPLLQNAMKRALQPAQAKTLMAKMNHEQPAQRAAKVG